VPQDTGDPMLQAWELAWAGHALRTDPGKLWHTNAFHPLRYTFAFSDTLLGYVPFTLLGDGMRAAVLRYNILFTLAFALAFFGAYALVRQLGAARLGAVVAAVAFAYAPWRWGQAGHLHVLSSGGIVLALAMLARGHGFRLRGGDAERRGRPGWAFGGWLVAAWQVTLGFGIGLVFVYVLAAICVIAAVWWLVLPRRWGGRRRPPFWLALADLLGAAVFGSVAVLMALPYLKVMHEHPDARRNLGEIRAFSPPWRGLLTAPGQSWFWGHRHGALRNALQEPQETAVLVGFALIALAVAGLFFSVWSRRTRVVLLAGVVVTTLLTMGSHGPAGGRVGYLALYSALPGWNALRTPGRLALWLTLLLGLLAAGAVSAFVERAGEFVSDRVPARPGLLLRLAMVLPLALVLVEGVSASPHPKVPPAPAALREAETPVLVLPSSQLNDMAVMLWSTDGWPTIVNGGSGFTPRQLGELREAVKNFPDAESVQYLRDHGIATVIVHKARAVGTPFAGALNVPIDDLDIDREDTPDAVVFHL
jgi:hypothetical protein